jgi:hypothetical protein
VPVILTIIYSILIIYYQYGGTEAVHCSKSAKTGTRLDCSGNEVSGNFSTLSRKLTIS